MKFEYDKEVDAAYIYLEDSVKSSRSVEIKEDIIFDLDKNGKIIGIEILNASNLLNEKSLMRN